MNKKRIEIYRKKSTSHVTYIMSKSYRVLDNHSLFYAIKNYKTVSIVIFRELEEKRQNDFFNSFINDIKRSLLNFGDVSIIFKKKNINLNNDIVIDKGYLKNEIELENFLKDSCKYGISIIESNVSVPLSVVSSKEEYAARTIRPKIFKNLDYFIDPVLEDEQLSIFETEVLNTAKDYIKNKLDFYNLKNHPEFDYTSGLSKYLKYGLISPIRILIYLEDIPFEKKESFVDELIVRRELAYNFVYYNKSYYDFDHITYSWAYNSMNIHISDERDYLYNVDDYINLRTHDKYFNAAMKEMIYLGKMHGYMRMYWCKKIIEWSPSYKYAYDTAIYLNNKYFLDGNTPNGYCGVAWCFGKHDRAWKERSIFGKIRYMNDVGLRRKFDIDKYITRINNEVKINGLSKTDNFN